MAILFWLSKILPTIITLLSFGMLALAFNLSIARMVHVMITTYQMQSYLLALITLLTAIELDDQSKLPNLSVAAFVIIPLMLAWLIEPLLAQATVPEDVSIQERLRRFFHPSIRTEIRERALPIWLQSLPTRYGEVFLLAFSLLLIVASFFTGYLLIGSSANAPQVSFTAGNLQANRTIFLAISLALVLLGLSTMGLKRDLISQVMGLLVMEHGLFLAAIRFIVVPSVTVVIVVSLFLYIIITLTILFFLLPELHRVSGSIAVEDQNQLKG